MTTRHGRGPAPGPAVPTRGPEDRAASAADAAWMQEALTAAERARGEGEVPIGAAVVGSGRLLAVAGNASVATHDPTGHAEVRALRAAGALLGNYRLPGVVLYVTVEPCVMCMGAAIHSRIARVVYGCPDPKGGAAGSVLDLSSDEHLNHRIAVVGGVEADACRALIQEFFRVRR